MKIKLASLLLLGMCALSMGVQAEGLHKVYIGFSKEQQTATTQDVPLYYSQMESKLDTIMYNQGNAGGHVGLVNVTNDESSHAYVFNGSSAYGRISDTANSPFDLRGDFTWEADFEWTGTPDTFDAIAEKTQAYRLLACYDGSKWRIRGDFQYNDLAWASIISNTVLEVGKRYQVTFTRNSTTGELVLYINGKKDNTVVARTVPLMVNDGAIEIGRRDGGWYLPMKLYELRLWNRALNGNEVQQEIKQVDASLLLYWKAY